MSSLRAGSAAAVDDDADAVARSRSMAGAADRTTNRERWRCATAKELSLNLLKDAHSTNVPV